MRKLGVESDAPPGAPVCLASYEAAFEKPLSYAQVLALGQLYGLSPPANLES